MKIIIAGGSGFVGQALEKELLAQQHHVEIISRKTHGNWDSAEGLDPNFILEADVVINLAGAGIADRRWSAERKSEIIQSRVQTTQKWVNLLQRTSRPITFIQASAVGYYGSEIHLPPADEETSPGNDFLSEVCVKWEAPLSSLSNPNVRWCITRFGVVTDAGGGALKKMLPLFRLGFGSAVAPGKQWMNPVSLESVVNVLVQLIHHPEFSGVFNVVQPQNYTAEGFAKQLGRKLNRPVWFPKVPAWLMRLIFGEMADVLVKGRKVKSKRLPSSWFIHPF
ncbi:MAG: hypothetical protein RIS99_1184 [Bacteroidota bacterium]|jgi:uncharacterized protein (TIGR01777 family)